MTAALRRARNRQPAQEAAVEVKTRLRDRRQLTLPEGVASAIGAVAGQEFVATYDPATPDVITLRRVRDTYYGILAPRIGDPDAEAFIDAERAAWSEG